MKKNERVVKMNAKKQKSYRGLSREGASLVTTVIMLSVAGLLLGSVLTASLSYAKQAKSHNHTAKAMFLADAGLRAAMIKLNGEDDGVIKLKESRSYFSDQSQFANAIWGFETSVKVVGGTNVLVSTGIYQDKQQQVETSVLLGSGSRSIHALYAHAMFAGNHSATNYTLEVGGYGSGADFVKGDVYCGGNILVDGSSDLRLPEIINEVIDDNVHDPSTETWEDAFTYQTFSNALSKSDYDDYVATVSGYEGRFYNNGVYDYGEPFVDTVGNGIFDENDWFDDANGNGVRDSGDGYIDSNGNGYYDQGETIIDNGNGVWDEGEEWVDNTGGNGNYRNNGRYDPAGGYWEYGNGSWSWKTSYTSGWWWWTRTYSCADWPPETFEDQSDVTFSPGERWVDQNGIYDEGEEFLDDRNGVYDYGTQAYGTIWGMPSPGPGQRAANGGDALVLPPDLQRMYYHVSKDSYEPVGALSRWGHDVAVTSSDYGSKIAITDSSKPEHIFIRNPPRSGSTYSGGAKIYDRSYSYVYDDSGHRVDDYFLEDPTDPTYNSSVSGDSIDGTTFTAPMYINVKENGNVRLYYVDGNVYIHHPRVYSMRFRQPGTRITIVAKGNITLSDEFYYNAGYDHNLGRSDLDSTIVNDPSDALCFIALKNPDCEDSGNIYIGDSQFGTGGSIHAMLYAENNFVDKNLDTSGQPFISIFGNMSAGNQIRLNRTNSGSSNRTRLDVTLDERVREGRIIVPGLPHPVGGDRSIQVDTAWKMLSGSWKSWSMLQ